MYRELATIKKDKPNPLSIEVIEDESEKYLNSNLNLRKLSLVKHLRIYYNVLRIRQYLIEKREQPFEISRNTEIAWHVLNQFHEAGWKIEAEINKIKDPNNSWAFNPDFEGGFFCLKWAISQNKANACWQKFFIKKESTK